MSKIKQTIENMNLKNKWSKIKQTIENMNLKDKWSNIKQTVENMNLKDKWSNIKLKLDQIPIPKWMLVIMTSISVIVAIASFVSESPSKSPNKIVENKQSDPTDENDIMLEEFALKVDRIIDLIYDMKESDHPFMYTKQIETLAAECEKLEKKLNAASLSSRQKLYKDEIKAELEDAIRRLTWN